MPGVRVVTDSACDLPNDLAIELDIDIVPLTIRFGDEEFVDRRDLSPKQFWARCATSPVLPETAAPSAGAFEEAFRSRQGRRTPTASCASTSPRALRHLPGRRAGGRSRWSGDLPVRVVDSLLVTMGLGLIALAAARLAARGARASTTWPPRPRTSRTAARMLGTLDTLENLKKGGRIGGAQAMLGSHAVDQAGI